MLRKFGTNVGFIPGYYHLCFVHRMAPLYTYIFRVPLQFQFVDKVAWWMRHLRMVEDLLPPPFDGGAA
eukprot:11609362-Karenia_brevis.AAC.1